MGVGFREGGLGGGGEVLMLSVASGKPDRTRNEKVSHDKSDLSEQL